MGKEAARPTPPQPVALAHNGPDAATRARLVVMAANATGVPLRASGSAAVALACPSARRPPLAHQPAAVELVGLASHRHEIVRLLRDELGQRPDEPPRREHVLRKRPDQPRRRPTELGQLTIASSRPAAISSLGFTDARGRHLTVSLDGIDAGRGVDVRGRMPAERLTLAPADLLLGALRAVEPDRAGLRDATALLLDHPLGLDDARIDIAYIALLAAADWALWRTATQNLERVEAFAAALPGVPGERAAERANALASALQRVAKTRRWRMSLVTGGTHRLKRIQRPLTTGASVGQPAS